MRRTVGVTILATVALAIVSGASVAAPETSLRMSSDPGDYPGGGGEYFYSSPIDEFQVLVNPPYGVLVELNYATTTDWWRLEFQAPFARPLTPGTYLDASRYPFQFPEQPGLSVAGIGRGCNTLTGGFRVKQVTYGPSGVVETLWVIFEQHCEGQAPALHGDLRINADVVVAVTAPFDVRVERKDSLSFAVSAADSVGRHVALTATGLPEGASFVDHGDNSATFAWVPAFTQRGSYEVTFHGDNGAGGIDDTATRITVPGTSSLLLDSEPGDFVGAGQLLYFGASDGSFDARRDLHGGVSTSFLTRPLPGHFWHLDFAAPYSAPLEPGVYTGATRYPFQSSESPGLGVAGDGRGCNTLDGSFEIKQIEYGARDEVTKLWATFEQHCEGMAPLLRGELRVNADVPVVVNAPTAVAGVERRAVTFEAAGFDAGGGGVVLDVADGPPGSTFTDRGNGTGIFRWIPTADQIGPHVLSVEAENGEGVTDRLPVRITVRMTGDDFDDAIAIARIPFADARSITKATAAEDDPFCLGFGPGIWYAITPAVDTEMEAALSDHGLIAAVSVYSGARGALQQVACSDDRVRFTAHGGTTYHLFVRDADGRVSLALTGAPALTARIDALGSFDARSGRAAIGGIVTCARPGIVTIHGRLLQSRGPAAAEGEFETTVACMDRARWTAIAIPTGGAFRAGPASASVSATLVGEDDEAEAHAQATARVRLTPRARRF